MNLPDSGKLEAATGRRLRVAVVQDGARNHYALPIALHRAGLLARVFTDWYSAPGSVDANLVEMIRPLTPELAARMEERFTRQMPAEVVRSSPLLTARQAAGRCGGSKGAYWRRVSDMTRRWIERQDWAGANALIGYVRNVHPLLVAEARRRGMLTVADQMIAPVAIELAEARVQQERFPGWETQAVEGDLEGMQEFEESTWPLLHRITCASQYVLDGLVLRGVDATRITVVHYPIDSAGIAVPDRRRRQGPLVVGFVGQVGLRKGAGYFFDVARKLATRSARFVMVGPVHLNRRIADNERGRVELVGRVLRSQVATWMEQFDVMLFPSTCEGSAIGLLEAMASGLPVVTTPNSGCVGRAGIECLVARYDQTEQLAAHVDRLLSDSALRHAMGQAARARVQECSLENYSLQLSGLLEQAILDPSVRMRT